MVLVKTGRARRGRAHPRRWRAGMIAVAVALVASACVQDLTTDQGGYTWAINDDGVMAGLTTVGGEDVRGLSVGQGHLVDDVAAVDRVVDLPRNLDDAGRDLIGLPDHPARGFTGGPVGGHPTALVGEGLEDLAMLVDPERGTDLRGLLAVKVGDVLVDPE